MLFKGCCRRPIPASHNDMYIPWKEVGTTSYGICTVASHNKISTVPKGSPPHWITDYAQHTDFLSSSSFASSDGSCLCLLAASILVMLWRCGVCRQCVVQRGEAGDGRRFLLSRSKQTDAICCGIAHNYMMMGLLGVYTSRTISFV
jgi:hypothetical protein